MTSYNVHYTHVSEIIEEVTRLFPDRSVSCSQPDSNELTTVTFTPDFTGADLTTVDEYIALRRALRLDVAHLRSLRNEYTGLRAYHELQNPTNAQSVAAIKAIIRVLRAILADD